LPLFCRFCSIRVGENKWQWQSLTCILQRV